MIFIEGNNSSSNRKYYKKYFLCIEIDRVKWYVAKFPSSLSILIEVQF